MLGAAGGVGRQVVHQLLQRGDTVRALVRREEQADALDALGAVTVLGDLTGDWERVLEGADAVVWAAGAGAGGQFAQVDGEALKRVADRLAQGGPTRLIVVSSMGVDRPEQMPPFLTAVLKVKAQSDAHVQASGLAYTIVRPGGLTNDAGTGQVTVGLPVAGGMVPREDVAAAVLAALDDDGTVGRVFEMVSGETPVTQAVSGL
ncbi:NAD dependent epimerase/dehydratase [Deinococcus aquiradiocola]|uniref:NAD dependent epimerase/dehydratase n=1 Tax=Deinococcus aquiradiocola TaxID=393059 RepID=A0A917P6M8_9DEIO|nr:NAD dependent epimerase/dehydratase [Deinococcus aquiradiocola]